MKTKLIMTIAGLVLLLTPAQAAFRDLLANYINAQNAVAAILGKVNNENDAKAGVAAIDAAVTAMKTAQAQVAAGSTNTAEVNAAVTEKTADMQKASAALAEQLHRVRKNKGVSQALAAVMAKLT